MTTAQDGGKVVSLTHQPPLTLLWYHGVYMTPILFDSRFFIETVTNTDIAFYVFLCKAFLTVSHTFARFCVFPLISYLCLFPLGHKRTPLYLPCSIDSKMQKSQYVYLLLYIRKFLRHSRACLSIFEYKPVLWNIIWGVKNIVINCVYIMVSFWQWGHVDPMVLLSIQRGGI